MHPTEYFLSLIWPSAGNKCIVTIDQNKKVQHHWYEQGKIQEAAAAAVQLSASGLDVYFGVAGFTGRERKADQFQTAKCIWLDIDCGTGKEYPTRSTAGTALQTFINRTGLPVPLIVSSGYGLHVYWVFDDDLDKNHWQYLADKLKQLCTTHGLHADLKCTADAARILRPIGTFNYKNGVGQKVRILNKTAPTIDGSVAKMLGAMVSGNTGEGFDLSAVPAYAIAHADQNPFKSFTLPENVSEGGRNDTLFKMGSSLRARGYDTVSLRTALHAANVQHCHPPLSADEVNIIAASCAKFHPGLAEVKKSNGSLTFTNPRIRVQPLGLQVSMPTGKGEATQWEWTKLADYGIRPVMTLQMANGQGAPSHYVWMETYDSTNVGRDSFLVHHTGVTNSAIFATDCGDRGFSLDSEKFPAAYKTFHHTMREWVRQLQRHQGSTINFRSFGWIGPDKGRKDSFLLGNTLYRADGEHAAPPIPDLMSYQEDMHIKGTLEAWTKAMDNYNLPGMEAYMFASWTAWAAPLIGFTSSGNIVFHLVGETGVGKTSLQRSIISTYGDWNSKNLVDVDKSTLNSVGGMMGIFNALPYCKEEITEAPPQELASWALTVTQGREKGRLNKQLGVMVPRTWNTIAITSANTSLRDVIRNERMDNAARLARVWEQDVELPMDQMEALRLFAPMKKNYGHAGPIYIKYVVENYDEIRQKVIDTEEALFIKLNAKGEERFNISLLAAAFVGAKIAIGLGLIHHDFERGRTYAIRQYNAIRRGVKAAMQNEEQILSAFLQENLPNTLIVEYDVTTSVGIIMSTNNIIKDVPNSEALIARFAKTEAKLYIVTNVLRKWYADKRLNFDSDMKKLQTAGILTDINKHMTLTKGTHKQDALKVRCCWFDLSKSTELIETIVGTP